MLEIVEVLGVLGGLEELEALQDGLKTGAVGLQDVLRALFLSQFPSAAALTWKDCCHFLCWQLMTSLQQHGNNSLSPRGISSGKFCHLTSNFIQNEGGKWRHGAVSQGFSSATAKRAVLAVRNLSMKL